MYNRIDRERLLTYIKIISKICWIYVLSAKLRYFMKNMLKKYVVFAVIGLIFIGAGLFWFMRMHDTKIPTLPITVYGSAIDPRMNNIERILMSVEAQLAHVSVDYNYISRPAPEDEIVSEEYLFEQAENARRTLIFQEQPNQFYNYLLARDVAPQSTNAEAVMAFAGIDGANINEQIAKLGDTVEDVVRSELETKQNELGQSINALPIVFIGDTLYTGVYDLPSFLAEIYAVTQANVASDQVIDVRDYLHGQQVYACYADSDCDNRDDQDGFCEQPGTEQARCVYQQAAPVFVTIITNGFFTSEEDPVLLKFDEDIKDLRIKELVLDTPEAKQIIERSGIERFPAYIFDSTLERNPFFDFYIQNNIIKKTSTGYLFNDDVYPRAYGTSETFQLQP